MGLPFVCIKRGKSAKQRKTARRLLENIAKSDSRYALQVAALVAEGE